MWMEDRTIFTHGVFFRCRSRSIRNGPLFTISPANKERDCGIPTGSDATDAHDTKIMIRAPEGGRAGD
jgi:hypothetical protein